MKDIDNNKDNNNNNKIDTPSIKLEALREIETAAIEPTEKAVQGDKLHEMTLPQLIADLRGMKPFDQIETKIICT